MKACKAGSIPARFNRGQARPPKIKHCQAGSGYTSYKVYSRTTGFSGRRFFKVKSGSGSAERNVQKWKMRRHLRIRTEDHTSKEQR